tara:strand:+ start:73638 stop:74132 length:495 start_codon:yes stop_codon:yes gene_type:complete
MRKSLFILTLLTIFSCETPVKKEKKKEGLKKETPKRTVVENEVDKTLVKLKRNPCSGDCPVFEVTITKDHILMYNGIQYTNSTGIHTVKLSSKQYTKLLAILTASNFSELKSEYADSGTKDFAETVITYKSKNVMVRLWKDAPENLTDIYVFIEDILYEKKYLE